MSFLSCTNCGCSKWILEYLLQNFRRMEPISIWLVWYFSLNWVAFFTTTSRYPVCFLSVSEHLTLSGMVFHASTSLVGERFVGYYKTRPWQCCWTSRKSWCLWRWTPGCWVCVLVGLRIYLKLTWHLKIPPWKKNRFPFETINVNITIINPPPDLFFGFAPKSGGGHNSVIWEFLMTHVWWDLLWLWVICLTLVAHVFPNRDRKVHLPVLPAWHELLWWLLPGHPFMSPEVHWLGSLWPQSFCTRASLLRLRSSIWRPRSRIWELSMSRLLDNSGWMDDSYQICYIYIYISTPVSEPFLTIILFPQVFKICGYICFGAFFTIDFLPDLLQLYLSTPVSEPFLTEGWRNRWIDRE